MEFVLEYLQHETNFLVYKIIKILGDEDEKTKEN